MSDLFTDLFNSKEITHRVCRASYTLNNTQPVICTIVGDQPLFYMDVEEDCYDEEDLFDAAELHILEGELATLKNEIEALESFAKSFEKPDNKNLEIFAENRESITAAQPRETISLDDITRTLKQSRVAAAYMDCARDYDVKIMPSAHVAEAFYDRKAGKIFINSNLAFADSVLLCARELRRHWQHRQGALINPLLFHPDNAVLINRMQNADLVVSTVRIAWELQLAGRKEIWERIEHSSMEDLGHAYAREAFRDFRTLNNGQASAAVFEAWFLSDRCKNEDKILIRQMLADYRGYVFDIEEARTSITPTLIAALGEMPFGKNYLAQHAETLINDPIFTDVRDRSNANFLWFIKFERSYRETEQELQTGIGQTASDIRQKASEYKSQAQDQNHAAEIITLFSEQELQRNAEERQNKLLTDKTEPKHTDALGNADNIVPFRLWSGN